NNSRIGNVMSYHSSDKILRLHLIRSLQTWKCQGNTHHCGVSGSGEHPLRWDNPVSVTIKSATTSEHTVLY
ncbi:MAG TPA: hypothetical protein VMN99_13440, partial [Anaerolineales bacterium]|nr:hypothetical protein [Anaerolineales bacterium]